MFREIGRRMEGFEFKEVHHIDLVLKDRPNIYMSVQQLINTVNEVVINTCYSKGYDKKAVEVLLNSDSDYINSLIKTKKLRVDKNSLQYFGSVFKAACKYYKDHFDNINNDLYDNVIKGFLLFIKEIEL